MYLKFLSLQDRESGIESITALSLDVSNARSNVRCFTIISNCLPVLRLLIQKIDTRVNTKKIIIDIPINHDRWAVAILIR